MEYTIENESLVYYALRNPENGMYFDNTIPANCSCLKECTMFANIILAKEIQARCPQFTEIRKVKVIDIGAVE